MELIDQLFFPIVVVAGIFLWGFGSFDKKLVLKRIYAGSQRATQRKPRA